MGRLHDRMDRELRIRGYAENTRKCYIEKTTKGSSGAMLVQPAGIEAM